MAAPPPGEIAYEEAHASDDIGYQIIVSNVVMTLVACSAVAARIASRRLAKVSFALDDYMVFAALVLFSAYIATCSTTLYYGTGKHIIFVTDPYGVSWTFLTAEIFNTTTIGLLKLSLLVLYNRIFPQRWFKYCLFGVGIFVLAFTLTFNILTLVQCIPLSKSWDPKVPGTCLNYSLVIVSSSALNACSDIVILILPIPLLWKLNLRTNKRNKLITMFTIGGLGCLSSFIRLVYCHTISEFDLTYAAIPLIVVSTVELGLAFLAACIPTYTAILNYFTGQMGKTNASKVHDSGNCQTQSKGSISKKHTWHTLHEPRTSDDLELAMQGGQVDTSISSGGK